MLFSAGGEALDGFLWVREDLAAVEDAVAEAPDPGDGDVTDAEGPTARVDPPPNQKGAATALGDLRGDQQLVPDLLDVAQVLLQAGGADVGGGATGLFRGPRREEPHPLVTELGDILRVAPVEGSVEALHQFPLPVRRGLRGGGSGSEGDDRGIVVEDATGELVQRLLDPLRCLRRAGDLGRQLSPQALLPEAGFMAERLGDALGDDNPLLPRLDGSQVDLPGILAKGPEDRRRFARLGDRAAVDQQR